MRWLCVGYALLGMGVGMLPVTGSQAASFDCAKATKPTERIICQDKGLSAADEQMAKDYARVMAEVPPNLKALIQKGQRSWIVFVPLTCSTDGRGTIKDQTQFAQCLKTEYDQRIATLTREPRQIGPFKSVTVSEFQAMPSSSTDPDFFPIVTHTKSVTLVYGGDDQQATRLNAWLQSLAASTNAGWNDPDTSASFSVSLSAVNAVLATATLSSDLFGVGAAHPVATATERHLVLATGKALTYRDMFQPNARNALTNLVWTGLKKSLGNDLMLEKKSDLTRMVEDPGHWSFGAAGVTFNFNVYEVAAYVMGPQDITVPWSALRTMLTPLGQSIADATQ
jgi:uncharacterized protein